MKFNVILTLAVILCVQQSLSMRGYIKPIKWTLKQIGTRCRGLVYKLMPVSRFETSIYAVCEELVRPIDKGFISFKVSAKTATMQNYRQIIHLKRTEPCKILADSKGSPFLGVFLDKFKELFPQYIHNCPYTEIKIYNISLGFMQNPPADSLAAFNRLNFHLPNAVYKVDAEAWDEETGDGMNTTMWLEAKYKKRSLQDLSDL